MDKPREPLRRMPDGTPCWCLSEQDIPEGSKWSHSPRCLAIRALRGGYDFTEAGNTAGKRKGTTQRIKKRDFLRLYAQDGILGTCAAAVGVDQSTVYRWRDADPVFAAMMHWAAEYSQDLLEQEARRRAVEGTVKPVYQGGRLVGEVTEYSDTLLIFLMKGGRPGKYRERVSVEVDLGKRAEEVAAAAGLPVDQVLAEAERLLGEGKR